MAQYSREGADSGYPLKSGVYRHAGTEITVPGNKGELRRTGSVFDGWNTSFDETGTPGKRLVVERDISLYAVWKEKLKREAKQ